MSSPVIYPWQHSVWSRLLSDQDRLPHAILLHGPHGTGKFDFVLALVQALLCQTPSSSGHACGECISCRWIQQDHHPDYRLLSPEQDDEVEDGALGKRKTKKTQISVAQVRALSDFLELTSHRTGGRRIVVIYPAEALNVASANALLKVLEEPPSGMMFLLVADQPQRLLPTILSRCQQIEMPLPSESEALSWLTEQGLVEAETLLAYAGGAPLAVLDPNEPRIQELAVLFAELGKGHKVDAFTAAEYLLGLGMVNALTVLQKWIYDLVSCRLLGAVRYHRALYSTFQGLCKSVDLGMLLEYQRKLNDSKKSALHPLNNELQLEQLVLHYRQLFTK